MTFDMFMRMSTSTSAQTQKKYNLKYFHACTEATDVKCDM